MKSLKKPPAGVDDVTAVVLILLEGNPKDKSWAAAMRCMNNVDKFLERLKGFKPLIDAGEVPAKSFEAVRSYLELPHFNRWVVGTVVDSVMDSVMDTVVDTVVDSVMNTVMDIVMDSVMELLQRMVANAVAGSMFDMQGGHWRQVKGSSGALRVGGQHRQVL